MNQQEILNVIFRLLKNIAPDTDPNQLKPSDNIRQTLRIDSFDYLQFLIALDAELHIETPEEDYGKIETLELLTNYIANKKKESITQNH